MPQPVTTPLATAVKAARSIGLWDATVTVGALTAAIEEIERLAKRVAELEAIALTCANCAGDGVAPDDARCGVCSGTGYVTDPADALAAEGAHR